MENEPKNEKSAWLTDLESKSWSLEMTISGAATFAVSYLPGMLDQGLDFYFDNIAPSTSKLDIVFPILSYSFFMVVSWVLFGFFVLHLCMRALWVGTIGLHAAFPEGIVFDKLPNVSVFYKKLAKEKFGTLEQYIFRLDKRSNKMFALAFALAMAISGIGIIYLALFGLLLLLRNSIDPETLENIGMGLYVLFMATLVAILLTNWWLKRHPEHQRLGMAMARIQLGVGSIANPFFSKAMQYLSLTFMSNMSRRSFYAGLALITTMMVVLTLFVTLRKTMEHFGRNPGWGRAFFSNGSPNYQRPNEAYDAHRAQSAAVPDLSIPTDVVDSPFLPVFVKYPRSLDARLTSFCVNLSPDETLSKAVQRHWADSININCLSNFFQLRVNDSINPPTDWLFTAKNGTKGIVTYLDTRGFPPGKNVLSVKIPSETKPDSTETLGRLYFWLVPK
jgi:hypothetical protein